jgi:hypothetical protein
VKRDNYLSMTNEDSWASQDLPKVTQSGNTRV